MTVLGEIIDGVREDLEQRRARVDLEQMKERAAAAAPARSFAPEQFGLICEVKRSSPSKGALADIADPAELAAAYEAGGAAAISVLTEERRFGGSLEDFAAVRARVDVPLLRKDFMVDEYQVYEARAYGADIILLIVAALDDEQMRSLYELAHELGMAVLVEAHTSEEIARAAKLGAKILGVNTRNLKDLSVDPARFAPLAAEATGHTHLVAESGVATSAEVELYAAAGADLVLVGEALVKHGDPQTAVAEFTRAGRAQRP
ncbi:indole-3-glycerol phosphate synthase TrpC [Brevibacterium ravenspurgense]|uniref:Indole-3-glycerol phosphate synthase n=1 Tax=Brevibacterium ravenspurgense TaxID=479117 RepID=A0A2I1IEW9_9MICO|nr:MULTISPECIES: indole-3-glycerol phosphate synthase TrpC [Brevibacterium]OFT95135.1 indole-3-glycerol phosphate synthase [Brevibacterium sp. HMSC24B04]OFT98149.1 indole-3-glycerol phosphate synthase [Brevibacterium sp. HMSC22B09]PKY69675.1 indole-3-glycerol phosphate synthase TrpC [Brevibacterium ravenspurgense]